MARIIPHFSLSGEPSDCSNTHSRPFGIIRAHEQQTCFSVAAKSYNWYVDGEKIARETGESLTINWTKTLPHVHTYSVEPVYAVFGEETRGKAAEATVEFVPVGTSLIIW